MKLRQLKMLVAVADTGSFSAAALQLDCTQSSVSHAIGELERTLGARLLARSRDGSIPTDVGRIVVEKARQMLRLEASLIGAARDGGELSGQVRIACFRSVGTHLLPHAIEALTHEYPGIRIDIDDGCDERGDVTKAQAILERCHTAGFSARPDRTLANDTSIAGMVGRGIGYAILPELSVFPKPEDVQLLPLPIPARREFVVAGTVDSQRSPALKAVVRFLRDKRILSKTRAHQLGVVGF